MPWGSCQFLLLGQALGWPCQVRELMAGVVARWQRSEALLKQGGGLRSQLPGLTQCISGSCTLGLGASLLGVWVPSSGACGRRLPGPWPPAEEPRVLEP